MTEKGRCTAIAGGGGRCKGIAIDGSGLCHAHHPKRAEARRRAASKGGKRGGRGRPVAQLAALRTENADIRARLLKGDLAPGVAAVAVQSLNCDIRAVVAAIRAQEAQEIEERLAALEEVARQAELQVQGRSGSRWVG